jgi:hypothetical protein
MTQPPRTFDVERDLGYRDLIVSGCSFTNNFNPEHVHTWPYYLRDLGGFEQVWDGSCAGAGNNHIARSIVTGIELGEFDPAETLVVVMWSGYDRDDLLVDPVVVDRSQPDHYSYTDSVSLGMTGGLLGDSNLIVNVENLKKIKNLPSRALENYVVIQSLAGYLDAHGIKYVFTEFSTPGQMKDTNFDPVPHLPTKLQQPFIKLVRDLTPNLGDWALPGIKQNKHGDGYHPDADQHLTWCRQVLLPYIPPSTSGLGTHL